jgi:hypothetical protein
MNLFAPVALWGFWLLLGGGWMLGELSAKGAGVFVLLWIAGVAGSRFLAPGLLLPYVALLDIALVFVVFEGDVTLR